MSTIAELGQIPRNHAQSLVLNSWKEIANYLGRTVRTVQRWENELGLPVRRPHGRRRSAVFAFAADIDDWLKRIPVHCAETPSKPLPNAVADAQRRFKELVAQSRELCLSVGESCAELRDATAALSQTIRKVGRVRTQAAEFFSDEVA